MVNQSQSQSRTLPKSSPASEEDFEFNQDVLKGYDRREVDQMALNFCDTMIAEEPEDEEFWNWLKGRIKGREE